MDGANCCCNVLWFIFGGLEICLAWCFIGVIFCCTIIGIPIGIQCFKIGCFALCPFGKETMEKPGGASACDCILNVIWCFSFGLFIAIFEVFFGLINCITIVGIPCGIQHFKLAKLAFMPFGQVVVEKGAIPPGQPIVVVQPVVQTVAAEPIVAQPMPVAQPPQYAPPTTPMYPQY